MVSKIEAAERLAEAVERHRSFCEGDGTGSVAVSFNTLQDAWKAVGAALSAYRSASVPSDELTDEEREVIVDAMQAYLVGDPKCEPARSILRKLGREPVWEWDEANATMTLGGKFSDGVFPCAAVSLFYGGGLLCRIHLSEMKELHQVLDNYAESLEWCEQQLREARQ